jgi:serine/threonine-protein kinase TNNI3K
MLIVSLFIGLQHLHMQQPAILHLDVKPGNILFNAKMQAKLCDFGMSRVVDEASCRYQSSGRLGTYDYMDSDMLENRHYSGSTDVYALGLIMCQLVTGEIGLPALQREHLSVATAKDDIASVLDG